MMLPYILKVLICSGVLYGYYTLALKNSRIHRWNRVFLLLVPAISLVLPLIQFPFVQKGTMMKMLEVRAYTGIQASSPGGTFDMVSLIYTLYIGVVIVLLVRMMRSWWKLWLLVLQGEVLEDAGYITIRHTGVLTPFSFFNRIFIYDTLDEPVLRHELAHIRGYHTIDKLWMEVLCAVGWLNPFFYLLKKELAMVHEFIADSEAAADTQADYAKVLLEMTLQTRSLSGVSTFGQSPVKRRINMLFADKTKYTFIKQTFIIPIAIFLLLIIGSQRPSVVVATPAAMEEVFTFAEKPPMYMGGEKAMVKYLSASIHYPKEAQKANVAGTVFVQFIVGTDGTIRDVKTVGKRLGHGLEEESIRVVNAMPKWRAGSQAGKQVSVLFYLPIRYQLES